MDKVEWSGVELSGRRGANLGAPGAAGFSSTLLLLLLLLLRNKRCVGRLQSDSWQFRFALVSATIIDHHTRHTHTHTHRQPSNLPSVSSARNT